MDPLTKARAALKRKREDEYEVLLKQLEAKTDVNKPDSSLFDEVMTEPEDYLENFQVVKTDSIKLTPYIPPVLIHDSPVPLIPVSKEKEEKESKRQEKEAPLEIPGDEKDEPMEEKVGFLRSIYSDHVYPSVCELPSRCLWIAGIFALSILQIKCREHLTKKFHNVSVKNSPSVDYSEPNSMARDPITVSNSEYYHVPKASRF